MKQLLLILCLAWVSCRQPSSTGQSYAIHPAAATKKAICCESNIPARFASFENRPVNVPDVNADNSHKGMIWIKGGTFMMGADNKQAADDEYPKHKVTVSGFWMDATELTNAEFAKFVKATGYITTAERKPDWNELKKQVPPGTPKPDDSLLVAASLVFHSPAH